MRISDWSSDVCSSDLGEVGIDPAEKGPPPKSALKAQAKAHSKQIRKARRGERRGRTAESKPTDFVGKPKPKAKAKPDRKSVASGQSGYVRVDIGGRRDTKKKKSKLSTTDRQKR